MKILVIGGAGFIGSHVADAYVAAGHEVAILDDFSTGSLDNVNVDFVYRVDICDRAMVRQVMELVHPDVVNHHAALVDVTECQENPDKAHKVNVEGTRIVFDEAEATGVKKFIFASSGGAIYGECRVPAMETWPANPRGVYGRTKYQAESVIQVPAYEITTVILRYGNVYGSRGERGVIPAFERAKKKQEPLVIYDDGEQVRDFIGVFDVARANVLALECGSGTFNIATGVSTSIRDLACSIVGRRGIPHQHFPARAGEIRESRLDVSRAKQVLGFEALPW